MSKAAAVAIAGVVLGVLSALADWVWIAEYAKPEYNVGVRVVQPGGAPFEGALVQLGGAVSVTDKEGIANLPASPGRYFFYVSATGYLPVEKVLTVSSTSVFDVDLTKA